MKSKIQVPPGSILKIICREYVPGAGKCCTNTNIKAYGKGRVQIMKLFDLLNIIRKIEEMQNLSKILLNENQYKALKLIGINFDNSINGSKIENNLNFDKKENLQNISVGDKQEVMLKLKEN